MSGPETPRSQSYEEISLRQELDEIIKVHFTNGDFLVIQEDDIDAPAEVIFAGKLRGRKPGSLIDVLVCDCILDDDERIKVISIGHEDEYQIHESGIISSEDSEFHLDDEGLMNLRFWLRETEWSRDFTNALLQKREHQS
jgi:hypothetical protein